MTSHRFDTRTLSTVQPRATKSQTLSMPASTAPQPVKQSTNHSFITSFLEHLKRHRLKYVFGSLTLVAGLGAYLAYQRQLRSNIERRKNLRNCDFNQSNAPQTLTDYETHAAHCMKVGDLAGAYHCLSDAIDIAPESATLYLNRANICYLLGDYDNCLEDANACIRIAQQKPQSSLKPVNLYGLALLMKGRALAGLEDYDNATHVIDQAVHAEKRLRRQNPSYNGKHGDQLVLDVMQECLTDALACLSVKQDRERVTHQLQSSSSQSNMDQSGQYSRSTNFEVVKPAASRSTGASFYQSNNNPSNSLNKSLHAIHHSDVGSAFVPVQSASQINHGNTLHSHHAPLIDRVLHAIPNPAAQAQHPDADDNQATYQTYCNDHLAPGDYLEEPMSPMSPVSPASPSILDAIKAANATAEKARLRAIARKARAQSAINGNVALPHQPIIVEREKSRARSMDSERPIVPVTSQQSTEQFIIDVQSDDLDRAIHANGVEHHRHRDHRLVV